MIAIAVVVVAVGLVAILRARARAQALTTVGTRLTLGSDGIVLGATTIDLAADGNRAVLMLHGFGDTPQTLQYLAAYLHGQGWAVRAPLLPGHGRTLHEFSASRAEEWIAFAGAELDALRARYDTIAIVGLSAFPATDGTTALGEEWRQAPLMGIVAELGAELPHWAELALQVFVGFSAVLILSLIHI